MAPGVLATDVSPAPEPIGETVTFHAGKGKGVRHFIPGSKPTFTSIPTVDFSLATSSNLTDRQSVANAVGRAFTETGFMYAVNHGIPPELLSEAPARVVRDFFALPSEKKMDIHINKSPAIRGYEALYETRLNQKTMGDMKEAFNCADDPWEPEQHAPADLDTTYSHYPPNPEGKILNQWPDDVLPAFRQTLTTYRDAVSAFAKTILRMVALSLGEEETYFESMCKFPMAGLRALRYPPAAPIPEGSEATETIGIGAHADYSFITLVNQLSGDANAQGGLEVLTPSGHWIAAPPVPGSLVVNVGDFLERATNDRFTSTVHRVRNCVGSERHSLAYFFSPSSDSIIKTVPSCVVEGEEDKYEEIRAGDWQLQRLLRARYKHPASVKARENGEI
ncbi:Clavaminate synthase-like protein [Phyllosticta capitalensis]|uniref:Clavaminate synthase-like protein n=1 Tax=Phyllosticta capitalensis TaxID=121624 RepID=UPI0031322B24